MANFSLLAKREALKAIASPLLDPAKENENKEQSPVEIVSVLNEATQGEMSAFNTIIPSTLTFKVEVLGLSPPVSMDLQLADRHTRRPSGKGVRPGTLEVFKLFYHGVDGKRNGVGVILKEKYSKSVVAVKRVSDRVMNIKLQVEGLMINIISAYAPQVGCEMEVKEQFWSDLDEVVEDVPRKERLLIGAHFNGYVDECNRGDKEVMGRYGLKERNVEGQMVVDFVKRMEMAVVNTYFKHFEHGVMYKSGGRCTQVDYVLCRRCNLKEIGNYDIVICGESRGQVEKSLESWRYALERREIKVSRSYTEYMCVNEREGSGVVGLQREEVGKVKEFRYLGSTVQSNEECVREVKKRVQAGWSGWRRVIAEVICDRRVSAKVKRKVYRTVVRPEMLYGLEALSKRQKVELEVAELKMLIFSLQVTTMDSIRNKFIRGTVHVGRFEDKLKYCTPFFSKTQKFSTHSFCRSMQADLISSGSE
ncbi:hypothetical protein C0J45_7370 [Silurus meridionalis]|nr:hypothetical protein C0J45_7370 [Silurus meridionalis]